MDSLWLPVFLSLDLPLVPLEGLGSLPASLSAVGWTLCTLWVDLPPSFLVALLPWLFRSGFSSSGFWGLLGRSFLPSPAMRSRGTSRGRR